MLCPDCGGVTVQGRMIAYVGKVKDTYPPSFDITQLCKKCGKHFVTLNLRNSRKTIIEVGFNQDKKDVSYKIVSQLEPPELTIFSGWGKPKEKR